jgi:predicted deacylase
VFSLAQAISADRLQGTVIAVPVVNPAAFAAGTRVHPEDGRNLARAFPGDVNGGPTERLAAAVFGELADRADYVIDLHSGGVEYVFLPVAGFYGNPDDGNASFQAARVFGLPALWQLPPTGGVLSCEAWRRGKVAIGAEYLGAGQLSPDGVRAYRNGVLACLIKWGMLAAPPQEPGRIRVFEGDWQVAVATGIFQACCRIGDAVTAGTALAVTLSVRGEMQQKFVSANDGVVLGLRSKAFIRTGNWAVLVGKILLS